MQRKLSRNHQPGERHALHFALVVVGRESAVKAERIDVLGGIHILLGGGAAKSMDSKCPGIACQCLEYMITQGGICSKAMTNNLVFDLSRFLASRDTCM